MSNEQTKTSETMKNANEYRRTDDRYGKAFYATVTDDTIVNYYNHQNQLIISTYDRRSTRTTEKVTALPSSLA